MTIRQLLFKNREATPDEVVLQVSPESIRPIMAWYGGYHAGDTYAVFVDGVEVGMDVNGELVGDLP